MRNPTRGWFITEGRDGDRTLEQQMAGLEPLAAEVAGKTVLDFGCAEGLIGMALMEAGAKNVTGLDSVDEHLIVGRRIAQREGIEILLIQANFNDYDVSTFAPVDIVLLLAILHKLHDPSKFARAAARLSTDLVVIRLPPTGLVIRDMRSLMVPHDIGEVMTDEGFKLESKIKTTGDEWLGYFRRPKKVAAAPAPAPAPAPKAELAAAEHRGEAVVPMKFEPPAEKITAEMPAGPAPAQHVTTAEAPPDKPHLEEAPKSDSAKDADAEAHVNTADKPAEVVPPVTTESFSGNADAAPAQDTPARAPRAPRTPRADKAKE